MKIPSIFQTLVAGTTNHLRQVLLWWLMLLLSAALALGITRPVYASDKLSASEVMALMQQGKIRPLLQLIDQHQFEGNLLDAELERDHGRLIYELEYLNDRGEVWEYELDAETGEILEQELED